MNLDAADTVTASSPCGGISVIATPAGIPVQVRIARSQLSADRETLAARIVALCAVARAGDGYRRRRQLSDDGTPFEVLDALGLPDRDRLLTLEEAADDLCRGAR